ncbi:PREDICTED: PRUPE_6G193600, partial [Prunus dulcis]
TGRGMSTMPRVVKRKLQKLRPIVEYNKRGKGIGQAHSEMQSDIGVLARSRVPLVDKKWSQIPKDIKEQIWEAGDMAFVKWKDFKSTLTRHYILPYTNDKEKLSQPLETYKFIEKAQWDAFVASRLSKDFESAHSQHAQIREKLEYNHRLSRKGYAGLEDQLEETMPGLDRQDKHGNIPDPKVAEKAKLIDELQKQVSKGKVSVYGSNDVLTMALGPEHPGRLRGVGAGISPRQYFNLPKPQRVSFDDRLKESLRVLLQEETKKMEAKAREETLRMEARTKQLVEAEREHFLSQLSQLIPNFDPTMLKTRISQSPKNPMSDKASCSGGDVRSLHVEDDTAKMGKHQEDEEKEEEKRDEEKEEEKEKEDEEKHDDKVIEVGDYSNMEAPSSLKTLCRYVETTLLPEDKILQFTIDKEVFGGERDTFLLPEDITQFAGMEEIEATVVAVYMRYLHDVLKKANMTSMVGFIDPTTVSANSGTIADRSRLVAARLQKTDGEQIFMMPYNPGRHWVLLIVRAKRETVYFLDPLPGHRVVDEEAKNIVNSAIKIYNSHIGRAG